MKSLTNILSSKSSDELIKEYEDCTKQLETLYENITNGLIIRSKADWYEKVRNLTVIFLIMKNLKSFYRTLYTRKSCKTERQCFEYLAEINTPVLTPDEIELCEGKLTLNEIFNALNTMPPSKTPGNDGLTKEFYVAFFDLLGLRLLKCLNYAFL